MAVTYSTERDEAAFGAMVDQDGAFVDYCRLLHLTKRGFGNNDNARLKVEIFFLVTTVCCFLCLWYFLLPFLLSSFSMYFIVFFYFFRDSGIMFSALKLKDKQEVYLMRDLLFCGISESC